MTRSPLLEGALDAAAAGLRVLPLYEPRDDGSCACPKGAACGDAGKHPRLTDWPRRATRDERTILGWWARWPQANVGAVVDPPYVLLDIDDRELLNGAPLPETLTATTGRPDGEHHWHKVRDGDRAEPRPGADVKQAGKGYAVIAPSLHKSGRRYAWQGKLDLSRVIELPAEWLAPPQPGIASGDAFALSDIIPEGRRHETLIAYLGALRKDIADDGLVRAAVEDANASRCRAPLDPDELEMLIRSGLRDFKPEPRILLDLREEQAAPEAEPEEDEDLGIVGMDQLPDDDPPPLLLGILHPEEPTIVFGPGDTGKGLIASWAADGLRRRGRCVLVIDFEGHPREWSTRIRALAREAAGGVKYLQPFKQRALAGKPLWGIVKRLRRAIERGGYDVVIIDSAQFACLGADVLDPQTPVRFYAALQAIGLPAFVIAHVTKSDERWPRYPFGSVVWHNGARVTWAAEKVDEEGAHVVELRCRKHNEYPRQPDRRLIVTWDERRLVGVEMVDVERSLVDRITEALTGSGPLTVDAIIERISDDDEPPDGERIAKLLRRYMVGTARGGRFVRFDTKPRTWALAGVSVDLDA